jgi:hypothetical protein
MREYRQPFHEEISRLEVSSLRLGPKGKIQGNTLAEFIPEGADNAWNYLRHLLDLGTRGSAAAVVA